MAKKSRASKKTATEVKFEKNLGVFTKPELELYSYGLADAIHAKSKGQLTKEESQEIANKHLNVSEDENKWIRRFGVLAYVKKHIHFS